MPVWEPILHSEPCIKKRVKPILTAADIPYEASLIFNAGVAKIDGKYVMLFRNDYGTNEKQFSEENKRFSGTSIGIAISNNGVDNWEIRDVPLQVDNSFCEPGEIKRFYDPRITVIGNRVLLCMAIDTAHGVRGCIAETNSNMDQFTVISSTVPDNRNMVLFPDKINNCYVRLERPFPVYSRGRDRFDIWISKSPDLKYWGENELVLGVEHVPYSNDKIGPAAPPVKTKSGWLTTFHAVDKENNRGKSGWESAWNKRYTAGIMLLDLEDPSKVIGMSKHPLIAPELPFETDEGFRQNVIFPGGMILENNGEVKIYYGASDTVECLATAKAEDLIALCTEKP